MKGVLLQFTESSPFWEDTILIKCTSWEEFESKLYSQFQQECHYSQVEGCDFWDSYLRVGERSYNCNTTVVMMEVV